MLRNFAYYTEYAAQRYHELADFYTSDYDNSVYHQKYVFWAGLTTGDVVKALFFSQNDNKSSIRSPKDPFETLNNYKEPPPQVYPEL